MKHPHQPANTHHAHRGHHVRFEGGGHGPACPMRPSITGHVRRGVDVLTWPHRCAVLASSCGFGARELHEIQIIAAELATNTLRHGGGGVMHARYLEEPRPCIEIVAEDGGPGFDDIEHALTDGVSRGRIVNGDGAGRFGDSLGIGLGAVARLADEVIVMNGEERGATVLARKYVA